MINVNNNNTVREFRDRLSTPPSVLRKQYMTDNQTDFFINEKKVPLIAAIKNPKEVLSEQVIEYMTSLTENKVCEFFLIDDLKDLSTALAKKPTAFIFCDHDIVVTRNRMSEFLMMFKTMIHFTSCDNDIKIGYLLQKTTPHSYVKELQKCGANGLVPEVDDYGSQETTKGIEALINGIPYWPKHLIDQLPGNTPKHKREAVHLTHRQQEVLELIANRGLSNKQIAKVLGISESTVKIHVSAIMKAYCVRNRTQLALTKK